MSTPHPPSAASPHPSTPSPPAIPAAPGWDRPATPGAPPAQGRGCWFYGCLAACVLVLVIAATAGITAWWVKRSLDPRPIEPVVLTEQESAALDAKLELVRTNTDETPAEPPPSASGDEVILSTTPTPEELDEDFVRKPLVFTERELNALISRNTDLADRVQILLRKDRIQLKGNFPVPEDAPFFGGRTIRINILNRVELVDGQLQLRLENVALGGVPIPNAWIGDLKGKDLAVELFADPEFARGLSEGVEQFQVEDGHLTILLAE